MGRILQAGHCREYKQILIYFPRPLCTGSLIPWWGGSPCGWDMGCTTRPVPVTSVPCGLTCSLGLSCFPQQSSILFPRLESTRRLRWHIPAPQHDPRPHLLCGLAQPASGPQHWGHGCLEPRSTREDPEMLWFLQGPPQEAEQHQEVWGKPLSPPPWGRLIPGAALGTSHWTRGQLCLLAPPRALGCPITALPIPLRLAFPGLHSSLVRCWRRSLPLALLSSQEPQEPSEKPEARVPALVHTGPNGKTRKSEGLSALVERVGDGERKAQAGYRRVWVLSSSTSQCLWDKI